MSKQPHPTTEAHRQLVLERLAALWAAEPHQRLGQLVCNLSGIAKNNVDPWNTLDLDLVSEEVEKQWNSRLNRT